MAYKVHFSSNLCKTSQILCTVAVIMMTLLPHTVYLSIVEPDPGGTTLINPDQNVSATTSLTSNTSSPVAVTNTTIPVTTTKDLSYLDVCPDSAPCEHLSVQCLDCRMNHYCFYGSQPTANCTVKPEIKCIGERSFSRSYHCSYCYQLDPSLYSCTRNTNCNTKSAPRQKYNALCSVKEDVMCLGERTFQKSVVCNWTSGYKWSKTLVLSITLGGFGVDRFYLGLWREGIGKLFSFGGLGVWTLVDVILIAVGYIGPYDGSLYIYPWD